MRFPIERAAPNGQKGRVTRGRYFVSTFGCRVNQSDSQGIEAELEAEALVRAESHHEADVVVINTCTVTHRSDADVRKLVHRIQRDNPEARIVVTGCYAQRDPQAVAAIPGASAVIGHSHRLELSRIVGELIGRRDGAARAAPIVVHTAMDQLAPEDLPPVDPVASVVDRTRPFVKIQDGCDAACTYCVIPSVRGAARSARPERIVDAVESLVRQGYFEIVLAGIHLGTYGVGLEPPETLVSLVRRVLAIAGLGRLRLSCIEPMAFPLELADIAAGSSRLAPHFHLPLQSGSDRVLKRMGRPYRVLDFAGIVGAIRSKLPEACLGTDVIVGFPGETEDDFAETCSFVERSGLDYLHVFSYSDREGVPSTRLPGKIDPRIIKERSTALHEIARSLWTRFLDRQIGRTLPAVTLERDVRSPGRIEALSDTYCPIFSEDAALEPNRSMPFLITARDGDHLLGVRSDDSELWDLRAPRREG
jgi:threonylcarbamoyladenosine tRNA methylthiotransferase MtaB